MRIFFNGAAQTVTGSQYLIEVNGQRLLLECGLFQGKRAESFERNQKFRFAPETVDAMILSHAHIDHSGNLPNLVKNGYRGPIFTTPATARLADVMLRDSGHIQEQDAIFITKRNARRGEPPVEPLYTADDAAQVVDFFSPVNYYETFIPIKGVSAYLADSGHILGAASIVLDIEEKGRAYRFCFSGDIGRNNLPLLNDPVLPVEPDILMMECTYGDKNRDEPEVAHHEFGEVVKRTIERGGKVIVPAFSVGRTQELVYTLNQLISAGKLPHIPVYVDSPLSVQASNVFQSFPEYFDEEARKFVVNGKHPALNFDGLTYIQSVDESKALNERREPMVIISASGMAENGRIRHHLANNINDPRNAIVIVSWQSPETLGRRLADHNRWVYIFGEPYEVKAEVVTINGFSAHADQAMLLNYAKAALPKAKTVILVHGEERAAKPFEAKLREIGYEDIRYPQLFDFMDL
ncbi:MAG: MBL fold metallo-hydrolase [Anaerolineae bacterium]|nr:MBL fold metallo-hydrolase [Anaerolineae bacterium]